MGKINIKEASEKILNFFSSTRNEVKMLAAACGYESIYDLKRNDLIPLTQAMARITRLPFVGID